MRGRATAFAALCFAATPANAACWQELAVYAEAQAKAEIAFQGARPDDGVLHRFRITFPENGVTFEGAMLPGDAPIARPWAVVTHNCPQGDATGEEIAACTVWQGPIYGVDATGNVFFLPEANAGHEAAATLLLPDFGAAVRLSAAWGAKGLSTAPKDDFKLTGCQD
ncbi:MAG: hypothetical protein IPL47_03530 [Phyllobacteriaceae bacterium]|nr:hypothetical protein [Phyllobacteriaceae bacterium]